MEGGTWGALGRLRESVRLQVVRPRLHGLGKYVHMEEVLEQERGDHQRDEDGARRVLDGADGSGQEVALRRLYLRKEGSGRTA